MKKILYSLSITFLVIVAVHPTVKGQTQHDFDVLFKQASYSIPQKNAFKKGEGALDYKVTTTRKKNGDTLTIFKNTVKIMSDADVPWDDWVVQLFPDGFMMRTYNHVINMGEIGYRVQGQSTDLFTFFPTQVLDTAGGYHMGMEIGGDFPMSFSATVPGLKEISYELKPGINVLHSNRTPTQIDSTLIEKLKEFIKL